VKTKPAKTVMMPAPPLVVDAEDALQAMLDADPSDWATRLVLADLLEERGDARAAGYRRLGELRMASDYWVHLFRHCWRAPSNIPGGALDPDFPYKGWRDTTLP